MSHPIVSECERKRTEMKKKESESYLCKRERMKFGESRRNKRTEKIKNENGTRLEILEKVERVKFL